MKIPSSFQLAGQLITVTREDTLRHSNDAWGVAHLDDNSISLQKHSKACPRVQDRDELTYTHELIHWLLYMATGEWGEDSLTNDEALVQRLAYLLHQYFQQCHR